MKIRAQNGEIVISGVPRWLAFPAPSEAPTQRFTAAAQLRQLRVEGIKAGAAESVAWFWLAAGAGAVLAASLWF